MTQTGQSGGVYEAGTLEATQRHCFAILNHNEMILESDTGLIGSAISGAGKALV
jgi:hypothetical protein